MADYIIAVDQGTTSSRAIVFDSHHRVRGVGQHELAQHYPQSGWVEHDPEDIWQTTLDSVRLALADAGVSVLEIAAVGMTNQRETTIIWDRESGRTVDRAIVWQDRRTAESCADLKWRVRKRM
jgi:glycerol kinase